MPTIELRPPKIERTDVDLVLKRKTSLSVASEAEVEEEVDEDEAPLGRKSSKHRMNSGYEDVLRIFSLISRVRSKVATPEVRDIPKVGIPSFSLVPAGPSSVCSRTPLSLGDLAGTPSPLTTPTFDLLETPIVDQVGDKGHIAPRALRVSILLSDFSSSLWVRFT
ncbi:hypothetical protein CJ030_MR8G002231 [Morella rubra]|uniref:Uncharacterized protein n=1 Tax=Morella rubra TaxID=262757 RepID=A0A6A1UR26_9ROSI|nr:hypothetical protein CJ030_MR8G002231 [Morella rubra]